MSDQGEVRFVDSKVDREDADALVNGIAEALTQLGLTDRFGVLSPRPVREKQLRKGAHATVVGFNVYIRDRRPDEPLSPDVLKAFTISLPESRTSLSTDSEQETQALPSGTHMVHGHPMTLQTAAAAVGVSDQSLRNRMKDGMTLEEAVDFYALKKAG